ncbi:hypothetical protein O988_03771 [Pseudogymnoascus sp. VKM F-3808]|nr:hypothetical protein O988_03771 [Pseudogymnoascus sp. VKM F-3808]
MAFTGGLEAQTNPQRKSVSTKSDESIAVAILALVPSQRSATSFWASRWASRNSTDRAILLLFRGMAIMSLTRKEKQNWLGVTDPMQKRQSVPISPIDIALLTQTTIPKAFRLRRSPPDNNLVYILQ